MKKPSKMDDKSLQRVAKIAARIQKLNDVISKAQQELEEINDGNMWVRYMTQDFTAELTQEQRMELYEYTQVIIYAGER